MNYSAESKELPLLEAPRLAQHRNTAKDTLALYPQAAVKNNQLNTWLASSHHVMMDFVENARSCFPPVGVNNPGNHFLLFK